VISRSRAARRRQIAEPRFLLVIPARVEPAFPRAEGAPYAYVGDGGFKVVDGEILGIEPEKRLVMTWKAHWDDSVAKDRASRVSYELSPAGPSATLLHLVHDDFDGPTATYSRSVHAGGWPLMLSSLKSLLETGKPLATK
jgi:uncharacterized protein YndB with AHSA1/START domain